MASLTDDPRDIPTDTTTVQFLDLRERLAALARLRGGGTLTPYQHFTDAAFAHLTPASQQTLVEQMRAEVDAHMAHLTRLVLSPGYLSPPPWWRDVFLTLGGTVPTETADDQWFEAEARRRAFEELFPIDPEAATLCRA